MGVPAWMAWDIARKDREREEALQDAERRVEIPATPPPDIERTLNEVNTVIRGTVTIDVFGE